MVVTGPGGEECCNLGLNDTGIGSGRDLERERERERDKEREIVLNST
jgi:hypothetical protein